MMSLLKLKNENASTENINEELLFGLSSGQELLNDNDGQTEVNKSKREGETKCETSRDANSTARSRLGIPWHRDDQRNPSDQMYQLTEKKIVSLEEDSSATTADEKTNLREEKPRRRSFLEMIRIKRFSPAKAMPYQPEQRNETELAQQPEVESVIQISMDPSGESKTIPRNLFDNFLLEGLSSTEAEKKAKLQQMRPSSDQATEYLMQRWEIEQKHLQEQQIFEQMANEKLQQKQKEIKATKSRLRFEEYGSDEESNEKESKAPASERPDYGTSPKSEVERGFFGKMIKDAKALVRSTKPYKPRLKDVQRPEMLDEEAYLDMWASPLNFLRDLQNIAEGIKHKHADTFPLIDYTWSRQPTFDESNVDEIFKFSKPSSVNFSKEKEALQRIREEARKVWVKMRISDRKKQVKEWKLRNLDRTYMSDQDPTRMTEAFRMSRRPTLTNATIDEIFDISSEKIDFTTMDRNKLRAARVVTRDMVNYFYKPWDSPVPPASDLSTLFRTANVRGLLRVLPNPQALLSQKLDVPMYWVSLAHEIWLSLVLERFNLFDCNRNAWDASYKDALGNLDLFYYSRNCPKFGRISHYILTGFLESRVPSLLRLLTRLNAIYFFEVRINWSLHHCGGFSRMFNNATVCTAVRYNIEAMLILWPFLLEWSNLNRGELCERIFDSDFTNNIFLILSSHQVPEQRTQAVHVVIAYLRFLTEVLYGARPLGFLRKLNNRPGKLNLWMQIGSAFHPRVNIYLARDLMQFVADLAFLTCEDRAPFLTIHVKEMLQQLEFIKDLYYLHQPSTSNPQTWEDVYQTALRLASFFNEVLLRKKRIDRKLLYPLTTLAKGGYRTATLWPSGCVVRPCTIPCWNTSCENEIVDGNVKSIHRHFLYCPRCYITSYCCIKCAESHWKTSHRNVCPYYEHPPAFLKFHTMSDKLPEPKQSLRVFFDVNNIAEAVEVRTDFTPIY